MKRMIAFTVSVLALSACETTYSRPGADDAQLQMEYADCKARAAAMPRQQSTQPPPAYNVSTTHMGCGYYQSTLTPMPTTAGSMATMSDGFANLAMFEAALENCMVSKGWTAE